MTIAEKLNTVAENQQKVSDAGKKAEYDRFWDVFQNNGEPTNYYYKFSYDGWTDDNYDPKYPIVCKTGSTPGMALFYSNSKITDTKVPIIVQGSSAQSMFATATALITIRKLTVHKDVAFPSTFVNCAALRNITIDGTIGKDIEFPHSTGLTYDSLMSIINALEVKTSGTFTCKLGSTNLAKLTDAEKAIATEKGWTLA